MSDIARFMHAYARFVHDKPRRLQISSFNVCYRFESCVIRPTRNTLYCPPDPGSQGLTGNHTTSVTRYTLHVTLLHAYVVGGLHVTQCRALPVTSKRRQRKTRGTHVLVSVKNCCKSMQAKLPKPVLGAMGNGYRYLTIRPVW